MQNINRSETNTKRSMEVSSTKCVFRRIVGTGILLNVVLGFVYLLMLNSLATRGFDLGNLKSAKIKIQKQIEEIDIALAIPTSLYALESDERVQNMSDIGYKTFLEVYNKDGRPYRSLFYYTDEAMSWASLYLILKKRIKL